jgi:Zn-dependent metalloprotease
VRSARIANAAATVTPVATQYVDVLGQAGSGQKRRTVADCHHDQEIRGATVMRSEGQDPTGDPAVDEAYDGLGATYDLYHEAYERDSIDNQGMSLDGFVHFGQDYDNAFWDGTQMVFGDGDGTLFQRFTIAVDVIGHELTHGVTQHEANLQYFGQSGALNESISDVFGSLVKQWAAQQTADQADWLIGAGLLAPGVQGRALRDMREPGTAYDDPVLGKDPQPAHMRDFVKTFEDNGGVHINSGIPNRAFALAATTLGGSAWERAGTVWYAALRDPRLRPTATFRSFARATVRNATRLFGDDVATAVHDAWGDVGVRVQR